MITSFERTILVHLARLAVNNNFGDCFSDALYMLSSDTAKDIANDIKNLNYKNPLSERYLTFARNNYANENF